MVNDLGTVTYNTSGFNSKPTIRLGPGRSGLTYNSPFNLSTTPSLSFYIVLKPTTTSGNSRLLSFFNVADFSPPGFNISFYNVATTPNIGFNRGPLYTSFNPTNIGNANVFTSIKFICRK